MTRVVTLNTFTEHAPRRDAVGRRRCKCGWPSSDVAPSEEAFWAHVEDAMRAEMAAKGLKFAGEETS